MSQVDELYGDVDVDVQFIYIVFCLQQRRRQLTDCALQWAEVQEILLGEESDSPDNRILLEERNRRTDRRQVKMKLCLCMGGDEMR